MIQHIPKYEIHVLCVYVGMVAKCKLFFTGNSCKHLELLKFGFLKVLQVIFAVKSMKQAFNDCTAKNVLQ